MNASASSLHRLIKALVLFYWSSPLTGTSLFTVLMVSFNATNESTRLRRSPFLNYWMCWIIILSWFWTAGSESKLFSALRNLSATSSSNSLYRVISFLPGLTSTATSSSNPSMSTSISPPTFLPWNISCILWGSGYAAAAAWGGWLGTLLSSWAFTSILASFFAVAVLSDSWSDDFIFLSSDSIGWSDLSLLKEAPKAFLPGSASVALPAPGRTDTRFLSAVSASALVTLGRELPIDLFRSPVVVLARTYLNLYSRSPFTFTGTSLVSLQISSPKCL